MKKFNFVRLETKTKDLLKIYSAERKITMTKAVQELLKNSEPNLDAIIEARIINQESED